MWSPIAKVYEPLKVGSIDTTDTEPHDHGIIRALNSTYNPNKDIVGDPHCTVFVARLNPKTDNEGLESAMTYFGEVKRVRVVRDIVTGSSRCYGFVEYEEEKSASRAQRDGNKMEIDGYEVFVDFELERTLPGWIPRRKGGGFGGKKESGQLRFGGRDRPWREPIMMQGQRNHQQRKDTWGRDRYEQQGDSRYDSRGGGRDKGNRERGYDRERSRERREDREYDTYKDRRHDRSRSRDRYHHK